MAKRQDINKRIAKAMNTDSQLSHFVINVLNPDFIRDSEIIDESTFEFVSNFIKDYDTTSVTDILKGICLKTLGSMLFTDNDNEDFNNFLALLAEAINKSKEVLETVMDIYNCIELERDDLDEVELVRNINLVLMMSAFDAFRPNNAEIVSEAASTSTKDNKESELSSMKSVKGRTITFSNGHTAHTVVANNINKVEHTDALIVSNAASTSTDENKVEHVEAEIVTKAPSTSTDSKKSKDIDMAKKFLEEMRNFPQFEKYASILTAKDIVEYQNAIKNGDVEHGFDYIQRIADNDNDKANALFVLFMNHIATEVLDRAKKIGTNTNRTKKEDNQVNPKQIEQSSKMDSNKIKSAAPKQEKCSTTDTSHARTHIKSLFGLNNEPIKNFWQFK